ncbi:MAG: hypothetical protein QOI10_155 [Solirubrobacterales bacterium]|jgi:hypothetical protein|nr:hypothetical protein [Solirubrobacterales bacterium]
MTRRRRTILLTLLALAAPLPAFAITGGFDSATPGPASISVSTSLDSCGVLDDGVVCQLNVSFSTIPDADTYTAAVTSPDGSVVDYGTVGAGGTSLYVPYVGAGNYSVRITAYGAPETPTDADGLGDVIATGTSRTDGAGNGAQPTKPQQADPNQADTDVTGRNPDGQRNHNPDGTASADAGSSDQATPTPAPTPAPTCTPPTEPAPVPPTPPVEPPADTDPANPDEDADGIPDDQERVIYEQQLDEYHAALDAQQAVAPATTGC